MARGRRAAWVAEEDCTGELGGQRWTEIAQHRRAVAEKLHELQEQGLDLRRSIDARSHWPVDGHRTALAGTALALATGRFHRMRSDGMGSSEFHVFYMFAV